MNVHRLSSELELFLFNDNTNVIESYQQHKTSTYNIIKVLIKEYSTTCAGRHIMNHLMNCPSCGFFHTLLKCIRIT